MAPRLKVHLLLSATRHVITRLIFSSLIFSWCQWTRYKSEKRSEVIVERNHVFTTFTYQKDRSALTFVEDNAHVELDCAAHARVILSTYKKLLLTFVI